MNEMDERVYNVLFKVAATSTTSPSDVPTTPPSPAPPSSKVPDWWQRLPPAAKLSLFAGVPALLGGLGGAAIMRQMMLKQMPRMTPWRSIGYGVGAFLGLTALKAIYDRLRDFYTRWRIVSPYLWGYIPLEERLR